MYNLQRRNEIFCLFLSIISLFIGGSIYLFYRSHTLIMFSWLRFLNLEKYFTQNTFNSNSTFLSFCVYSLPNGLWSFSAILLFGIVWKNSIRHFLFFSIVFTLVNLLFEFLQLFNVIPGTFDFIDILVLLISLLAGIFAYKQLLKGDSYESKKTLW
ncbi:hypothetical protein SAMN04487775_101127 [Treponema bryantii]|uniref:VanZ like family protein n=2 Tax=Treponema bryantii TaxID=163 RepID=A0A1I3HWB6_9SPIR|nr:hypothetical protein SAMN04487775_101127 [Treponema bryantii]